MNKEKDKFYNNEPEKLKVGDCFVLIKLTWCGSQVTSPDLLVSPAKGAPFVQCANILS